MEEPGPPQRCRTLVTQILNLCRGALMPESLLQMEWQASGSALLHACTWKEETWSNTAVLTAHGSPVTPMLKHSKVSLASERHFVHPFQLCASSCKCIQIPWRTFLLHALTFLDNSCSFLLFIETSSILKCCGLVLPLTSSPNAFHSRSLIWGIYQCFQHFTLWVESLHSWGLP